MARSLRSRPVNCSPSSSRLCARCRIGYRGIEEVRTERNNQDIARCKAAAPYWGIFGRDGNFSALKELLLEGTAGDAPFNGAWRFHSVAEENDIRLRQDNLFPARKRAAMMFYLERITPRTGRTG